MGVRTVNVKKFKWESESGSVQSPCGGVNKEDGEVELDVRIVIVMWDRE